MGSLNHTRHIKYTMSVVSKFKEIIQVYSLHLVSTVEIYGIRAANKVK